jgi:hypothetical protein
VFEECKLIERQGVQLKLVERTKFVGEVNDKTLKNDGR